MTGGGFAVITGVLGPAVVVTSNGPGTLGASWVVTVINFAFGFDATLTVKAVCADV